MMFSLTLLLFGIIMFLFLLDYIINYNEFAKTIVKIPGRPLKFIFGNSLDILLRPDELFAAGRRWAAMYNGIYRFYAYFIGSVDIYNPEDVEIIASNMKYHEKSATYGFLQPWLQDGLLLSHGPKWQQRRKILTAAFHFNILQKYHPAIEDNSERLITILENTNGEKVDVAPIISEYTLNTICETAMGTQLNQETFEAGKLYKQAIYDVGNLVLKRFLNVILHFDFFFKFTTIKRQLTEKLKIIHDFTSRVVKERKQRFSFDTANKDNGSKIQNNSEDNLYGNKKNRNAMLDLLISAQNDGQIDNAGIQEEVDTFMFEGHDTTAAGLTFSLLCIANDPEVQVKIIEELDDIFGKDTRQATMEDLANMRYLDRVIKEVLRLYPPVSFISRKISTDTILSGYTVPAGTTCNIHIIDLHRQEHLFKDALKFDPDRFLPENSAGRHNYAYIPFSAGPRNCIGQKFAIIEMKSALSAVLRNFKLHPVTTHSDLVFVSDLVLRNKGPVYVKFVKRSQN